MAPGPGPPPAPRPDRGKGAARPMANRTLQLVKEFLFPDRVEHHAIPVLDGGLSANDELDGFDEVVEAGQVEPEDVVVPGADASGEVIVSAGQALWRCPPGRSAP